jgi:hypothetical protein
MKRAFALLLFVIVGAGCSESDSPTAPDTTPSRIISIAGDLNFGNVLIRQAQNAGFTIANNGNSVLTIEGFQGPCSQSGVFTLTWRNGTIAPGAAQSVIMTFSPRVPINCTGTVTVLGDQTSGVNTITMTAVGVAP